MIFVRDRQEREKRSHSYGERVIADRSRLDSPKIPASPDSSDERSSTVSALGVAMATPPSDNSTCSSPLEVSGDCEVLGASSRKGHFLARKIVGG